VPKALVRLHQRPHSGADEEPHRKNQGRAGEQRHELPRGGERDVQQHDDDAVQRRDDHYLGGADAVHVCDGGHGGDGDEHADEDRHENGACAAMQTIGRPDERECRERPRGRQPEYEQQDVDPIRSVRDEELSAPGKDVVQGLRHGEAAKRDEVEQPGFHQR